MSSSSLALTQCGLATLPATPTVRSSCLPQVHVERFLALETRDRRHVEHRSLAAGTVNPVPLSAAALFLFCAAVAGVEQPFLARVCIGPLHFSFEIAGILVPRRRLS
jgi:hypothetical protein